MKALKIIAACGLIALVASLVSGCGGGASSVNMRSGKVYFEKNKDYVKAEEMFRNAVAEDPNNWEAYFYLGRSLAEQGKFKDAGDAFKTSVGLAPQDRKPWAHDMQRHYFVEHFNAGVTANGVQNYQEAATEFERAVAVDPSDAKGYVNLAYAYAMLGANDKALETLEAAVQADSTSVEAWRNLGISRQQRKENDLAAKALEHVLALQPGDAEALFTLGDIYFNNKEYQKALENYTKAAEKKADDAMLQYQIGATYFRLENYKEAGLAFQKSAALAKGNDKETDLYNDSLYNLGVCYVKVQDYDDAILNFETLLTTHETADIHEMLGAAYAKKGLKDKAVAEFERAKAMSGK